MLPSTRPTIGKIRLREILNKPIQDSSSSREIEGSTKTKLNSRELNKPKEKLLNGMMITLISKMNIRLSRTTLMPRRKHSITSRLKLREWMRVMIRRELKVNSKR